jgi:hypothetical protein
VLIGTTLRDLRTHDGQGSYFVGLRLFFWLTIFINFRFGLTGYNAKKLVGWKDPGSEQSCTGVIGVRTQRDSISQLPLQHIEDPATLRNFI